MDNAIEAIGLTKYYDNLLAVDHINFEVKKGEIFGFLGPNGAGKTTTLRLLTGQTKPTSGSATVAGHNIALQPIDAKEHVGVVPEVSNLYDEMRAWDNLIFAAQLYGVPKNERDKNRKQRFHIQEQRGVHGRCLVKTEHKQKGSHNRTRNRDQPKHCVILAIHSWFSLRRSLK